MMLPQRVGQSYVFAVQQTQWLLIALPGFCAAPLAIEYGPLIQVCEPWEGADDGPPVLLSGSRYWVAPKIQAADLRQLCEVAKHLHAGRLYDAAGILRADRSTALSRSIKPEVCINGTGRQTHSQCPLCRSLEEISSLAVQAREQLPSLHRYRMMCSAASTRRLL